jgi:hypothetical protein
VDHGSEEARPYEFGTYTVSGEFVDSVLSDGSVTLEEYALTIQQVYRCMVEGGLEGKVAFDLEFGSGQSDLGHPLDNDPDNPTDHASPVIEGCWQSVDSVLAVYERDHPETPQQREDERQAILACVRRDIPEVYPDLSEDWDLDTLRSWLYDMSYEEYATADVAAAAGCVNTGGAPWVSLREAAGLED